MEILLFVGVVLLLLGYFSLIKKEERYQKFVERIS